MDKKVEFGMQYYSILSNAIDIAENKWKQQQQIKLPKIVAGSC